MLKGYYKNRNFLQGISFAGNQFTGHTFQLTKYSSTDYLLNDIRR